MAHTNGDYKTARALIGESLALNRELGNKGSIALDIGWLGRIARGQKDHAAARALFEESLSLNREAGDKPGIAWSLNLLGISAFDRGEYEAARALHQESLALYRELRNKPGIIRALEGLAAVAQARPERAARLFGAAEPLREAMGLPLPPAERAEHEHLVAAIRTGMCEEAFAVAWAQGRVMSMDEAVSRALERGDPREVT